MPKQEKSQNPFASELTSYVEDEKTFYCMPGHKQGKGAPSLLKEIWGDKVFKYDITEVSKSDVLAYPTYKIKTAQENASTIMGSKRSWFLVNGSSVGIHAVIGGIVKPGEKVLVHRECHKAVLMGLIFSGAVPIYLEPVANLPEYAYGSVDLRKVEELLIAHDIKLVLVTSPNYYGLSVDIPPLCELCHTYNTKLFVDEAHGTHFSFHPEFPSPAISCGADYVVQSMHKTVGGLYQTALLHSASTNPLYDERIDAMLAMLQSTSPSALLLMSIDSALTEIDRRGSDIYTQLLLMIETIRPMLNTESYSIVEPTEGVLVAGGFGGFDQCKVIYRSIGPVERNLIQIKKKLSDDYGIEIELAGAKHLLLTLSFADAYDIDKTRENLIYFSTILEEITQAGVGRIEEKDDFVDTRELPIFEMTPRDAFYAPKKMVRLKEAESSISASMVCIYPPGYPLIIPGERIHEAAIHTLYHDHQFGFTIIGISEIDGDLFIDVINEYLIEE